MKVIQKYFLALLPPPEILQRAENIKLAIRDEFGIKYALKSPAHITLKMPFSYNEAKEELLVQQLEEHLKTQKPFLLGLGGVGTFGNRVIFLSVEKSDALLLLQQQLKEFCKRQLHLVDELSDRNYHPHMTVAFKDLKARQFSEVLESVRKKDFQTEFYAVDLVLLKRIEGRWVTHRRIPFSALFLEISYFI